MSTTSVNPDFNPPVPGIPPPLNPQLYQPAPTVGIDYTHLPGNLDPSAIPVLVMNPNPGPINPAVPPVPAAQPNVDLATVVGILTDNQSALQRNLIDVMREVAQRPVIAAPSSAPRGSTVKLRNARIFSGKHADVTPFLSEVKRIIEFNTISFPDDHTKVLFVGLNLKDGIPVEWFSHLENSKSTLLWNWNSFLVTFRKKFADPSLITTADQRLDQLKQTGSAHYYLTSFMEIASHLDMTEQTQISRFMKGLKPAVKDALVTITNRPVTLEDWEPLVISIDSNLHQRDVEHRLESKGGFVLKKKKEKDPNFNTTNSATYVPPNTSTSNADVVPMDIDAITASTSSTSSTPRGKLTATERDLRFKNKLCLYCGKPGHVVNACNARQAKHGQQEKAKPKTT
ncbi:Retrotransposon-derived protein PEG10 [Hypsizygus marmoreus]|uniref:Retrotransposon-derived protein PEG10 n=1 Tax=Hypsizygus marmoreus TaxID=39966 RepID=A0A369JDL8_HYPMA|nr:Retrotransposon-derived protein PEG10 [Hypsizygus marmoreus]